MTVNTQALVACGECGMPCRASEYHPMAACLMFKACHNSDQVRANLGAIVADANAFAAALRSPVTQEGEPSDERAAFEAWIAKDCGDLRTFGSGRNIHYSNSAVNNAWTGWNRRAALAQAPRFEIGEAK